jgi:hypothetical protein
MADLLEQHSCDEVDWSLIVAFGKDIGKLDVVREKQLLDCWPNIVKAQVYRSCKQWLPLVKAGLGLEICELWKLPVERTKVC